MIIKRLNKSALALLISAVTGQQAAALDNSAAPAATSEVNVGQAADPIYSSSYGSSFYLNRGQRKYVWVNHNKPIDYSALAAYVAIFYGDTRSVGCQVSLYDGFSRTPFKKIDCRRSTQWNPETPNVPTPDFVRAQLMLYNADFTQAGKRVTVRLTATYGSADDNDSDGLPGWYERLHTYSDADPADAGIDRDNDGFTTLDEYAGGSDPNDSGSIPASL